VKSLSEQSFYEILEVQRSATPEEVQRAYDRARALFGPGSLVSYTLLAPDEAEILSRRIEEARSVLLDPQARASYDERLPAEGETRVRPAQPQDEPAAVAAAPSREPSREPPRKHPPVEELEPPEGSAWTGDLLRQAREARGLSILQVSERTKVTRHHIENVEAERFDQLPVTVYLRGIVMAIARELRLDGQKVARSYMDRVAAARAPTKGR
jgi:curved DNA-binding protein CbpA